jgi:hypothetical protein
MGNVSKIDGTIAKNPPLYGFVMIFITAPWNTVVFVVADVFRDEE